MKRKTFIIDGNICSERIRIARSVQKPRMTQEDLATAIQLLGYDMTKTMISRIEKNERHVCDIELKIIAQVLGVSMEWLIGDTELHEMFIK